MATHISARVAWHMDGWNGHICKDPASNAYCVGCHSYPGEMIRERRDLAWEQANAGKAVADLDTPPPCMYSVNAFGAKSLTVFSDPPDFFPTGGASRRTWEIPPATVCIWPYEEMYGAASPQAALGTRLAAALASADIPVTITESFQTCTNDDVMDRLLTIPEEWQDAVLGVVTNGIMASSAGGIRP